MSVDLDNSSVLHERKGGLGRLTLNKPKILNALNLDMVRQLTGTLQAWVDDSDVSAVLIDGAGERGFCAGGDVRAVRESIVAGNPEAAATFFREEYELDMLINEYPKPVIVIADGITMGGGIGLAGHAAVRVVTERSVLAMPETRIGFTPDVGGSWLLAKSPGHLGEYLGLTGASMNAADAIFAGFADAFVPSERLPSLIEALQYRADPGSPAEQVMLFDETPEPGPLSQALPMINAVFSADSVLEMVARLQAAGAAGEQFVQALNRVSPTSLVVTLASIRGARELPNLRAALEQEFRLGAFLSTQPDMVEGIRAQLVDKDQNPKWSPATLEEVSVDLVERALAFHVPKGLWE